MISECISFDPFGIIFTKLFFTTMLFLFTLSDVSNCNPIKLIFFSRCYEECC